MARNTFHSYRFGLHCDLKVTFLNDSVSRSKRHLEEFEEGNRSDVKRQRYTKSCSSSSLSPSLSLSPSSGIVTSPIYSLATSGYCENSDLDDTLLEPSYGEKLDSPTGLSLEAEEKLLSDDLEISPDSVVYGPNTQGVGSVCVLASLEFAQLPRALDKTISSTGSLPPTGPAASSSGCGGACKEYSGNPASESYFNKSFQNQAGLGLGSISPVVVEAAAVRQQVAEHVSTNAVAEGPASTKQNERGGECTNDSPHETEGESGSASSHGEAAPSNSASDQREAQVEDPRAEEPKRPKRICIPETDLESSKDKYIYAVLNHASRAAPEIGEVNELHELMRKVASQNQKHRYEHPTDMTARNFAQRSNRTTQRFSLSQWADRSNRNGPRFESIPDHFERSPVPT